MTGDLSPDLTSPERAEPASSQKSGLALGGAELPDADAVAETAASASVDDFRGNGYSDVLADSNTRTSPESQASQARDSLGSRASVSETDAVVSVSSPVGGPVELETDAQAPEPFDATALEFPGADESDAVGPCVVVSTPEEVAAAREFFAEAKAAESAGQKKRAKKVSHVFSLMQYHQHPETGEVIFTQEQLNDGLAALAGRLYGWAYIWHDSDRLVEVDEGTTEMVCCGIKSLHVHSVLWFKDTGPRPTVRMVSDAFSVPSPRVRVPNEVDEIEKSAGRGAAEKAFYDLCEYLCHETRSSSGIVGIHHPDRHYLVDASQPGHPGKYQYGRGRVVANFEFGRDLDAHMATRHNAAEGGGGAKLSKLFQAVGKGSLTLKQVRDEEPAIYFAKGNLAHFQKLRGDFLSHQAAPESVMNFYIFGPGGVGKDLLAKALARALAPDAEKPYFKVGGENVSWEGYDGEPVVIWEDMRVGDMIRTAKSRGMLFRILGPWRESDEKPVVNIKNSRTQLLNRVNIVTAPVDYNEFLRGLAGEYEAMQGGVRVKHEAENIGQGYRRFPLIIPVSEREFGIYVNMGFLNRTREYDSYEKFERFSQNLEEVRVRCKAIEDEAERLRVLDAIERRTVAPIVEQRDRLLALPQGPTTADAVLAEFADAGQRIQPSAAETAAAEEAAERDRAIVEKQQRKRLAELEEHNCELKLCTCMPKQVGVYARHGDECPALSKEERQRREETKQKALDAKVERVRRNGGLLTVGGAS